MTDKKSAEWLLIELRMQHTNLKMQCDQLKVAISVMEKALNKVENEAELPSESETKQYFSKMTVIDGVYQFLIEEGEPCTTKKIILALKSRGMGTTSTEINFVHNIRTALRRLSLRNRVIRIKYGLWALKKLVPDNF
jgi:hypothetical protein